MIKQLLKFLIYNTIYFFVRLFKYQKKKVVIESLKSSIRIGETAYPNREFHIYNIFKKKVAVGKVMPGVFEHYKNQYCVSYGLFVHPFYRKRLYGERIVKSRIQFVQDLKYKYLIAFIRPTNKASINLYKKQGFEIVSSNKVPKWCKDELLAHKEENLLVAIKQF